MPRDSSGNYTLATDPVVGNTPVEASWANPTLADIAQALTDSLDRDGNGDMNVGLQYFDGSNGAPGVSWVDEPSTGFRRAAQFDQRAGVAASDVTRSRQATSPAGQQTPFEVFDGVVFKPILIGAGGVQEAPTFATLTTEGALTIGGLLDYAPTTPNVTIELTGDQINGQSQYAWGYLNGATGVVTNSRNVVSGSRLNTGIYRITFTEDFGSFGFGCVFISLDNPSNLSGANWQLDGNNRIAVQTGFQDFNPGDESFSFIALLDYTPPIP